MPALQVAGREPAISKAAQLNIASCMAVLCGGAADKDVAATVGGLLQGAAGKEESTARLSLLSLGAIGRSMDLSKQGKLQVGSRCCSREPPGLSPSVCCHLHPSAAVVADEALEQLRVPTAAAAIHVEHALRLAVEGMGLCRARAPANLTQGGHKLPDCRAQLHLTELAQASAADVLQVHCLHAGPPDLFAGVPL